MECMSECRNAESAATEGFRRLANEAVEIFEVKTDVPTTVKMVQLNAHLHVYMWLIISNLCIQLKQLNSRVYYRLRLTSCCVGESQNGSRIPEIRSTGSGLRFIIQITGLGKNTPNVRHLASYFIWQLLINCCKEWSCQRQAVFDSRSVSYPYQFSYLQTSRLPCRPKFRPITHKSNAIYACEINGKDCWVCSARPTETRIFSKSLVSHLFHVVMWEDRFGDAFCLRMLWDHRSIDP